MHSSAQPAGDLLIISCTSFFPAPLNGCIIQEMVLCPSSANLHIYTSVPKQQQFFKVKCLTKIYFWKISYCPMYWLPIYCLYLPQTLQKTDKTVKVICDLVAKKILLIKFGIQIAVSPVLTILVKGCCPSLHFICLDNCHDLLYDAV